MVEEEKELKENIGELSLEVSGRSRGTNVEGLHPDEKILAKPPLPDRGPKCSILTRCQWRIHPFSSAETHSVTNADIVSSR